MMQFTFHVVSCWSENWENVFLLPQVAPKDISCWLIFWRANRVQGTRTPVRATTDSQNAPSVLIATSPGRLQARHSQTADVRTFHMSVFEHQARKEQKKVQLPKCRSQTCCPRDHALCKTCELLSVFSDSASFVVRYFPIFCQNCSFLFSVRCGRKVGYFQVFA